MLSYRHGFHAGNPADVFKHTRLIALARAMQHKDKGILFVDTHAGPALYDLSAPAAQKTREYERGIGRLWAEPDAAATDYLGLIKKWNPEGVLRWYPGSPLLLRALLRSQDRLWLCELHPTEQRSLMARFAADPQVRVHRGDGYRALAAALPPPGGRGLIFIDPSWEIKDEIKYLAAGLGAALKRFARGVYAIWYPLFEHRQAGIESLPAKLGLTGDQWLDLRQTFTAEQRLGRMTGCGLALINCPYRARQALLS